MLKTIFKPFISFFKWHLNIFVLQKLKSETAKKYNLQLIEYSIIDKIHRIWKWTGIFFSFSSYVLFPIYLFLKYYVSSCPDVIFRLIEGHLFLFGAYAVCIFLQHITMEENIKEYKEFYEKYKEFL